MNHALIFSVHKALPHRPLGPHRIASYLREHDWNAEVVDFAAYWSLDELKELAKSRITNDTKFIGFSCWFGHWDENINNFVNWIKQNYKDVKTIYGSMTYPRFKTKDIDYYIVGYGEKAILELAKSFSGNTNVAFDPRFFGDKKLIVANETYPAFPLPSLLVKYEDRDYIEPWEWLTTELSRGCKFTCKFCTFPILGVKEDHSRTANDFDIQHRDAYDRFGVTNYYAADETINQDNELLSKFANVADKFNFDLRIHGFIRADLLVANEDTWDTLIRLGVLGHHYGVETFNKRSGSVIGKGMDPEKLQEGLIKIKNYFSKDPEKPYRGQISLICGLPYETKETWEKGVSWIIENWRGHQAGFNVLEIPINEKDSKLSFFSKHWKELGYKQSTVPWDLESDYRDNVFSKYLLDWENDNFSMSEAWQICKENYQRFNPYQTVGIWHFSPYGLTSNNDIKVMMSYPKYQPESPNGELENFLARYVAKKINWSK